MASKNNFLFSLTNSVQKPPTKFPAQPDCGGTLRNSSYGPWFGNQKTGNAGLRIHNNPNYGTNNISNVKDGYIIPRHMDIDPQTFLAEVHPFTVA